MTQPRPKPSDRILVRQMQPGDIDQVEAMSDRIYPGQGWERPQLESHLNVFPHGQLVAVDTVTNSVVGCASSLIIDWDEYRFDADELDRTAGGWFTNHDPEHGRTLWGADVESHPDFRRMGIGRKLYTARRQLCRELNLLRIRAGARLRGYREYRDAMSPEDYVIRVVNRELNDPTLSFQLHHGFRVLAVIRGHLKGDRESCGHVAIIEWINHQAAKRSDFQRRDPRFGRRRRPADRAEQSNPGT